MNLTQFKQQTTNTEITNWIDSNLKNYLDKTERTPSVGEIEHIIDFFHAREVL